MVKDKFKNVLFSEECSAQLDSHENCCVSEREVKVENLHLGQRSQQRSKYVEVLLRVVQSTQNCDRKFCIQL